MWVTKHKTLNKEEDNDDDENLPRVPNLLAFHRPSHLRSSCRRLLEYIHPEMHLWCNWWEDKFYRQLWKWQRRQGEKKKTFTLVAEMANNTAIDRFSLCFYDSLCNWIKLTEIPIEFIVKRGQFRDSGSRSHQTFVNINWHILTIKFK